MTINEKLRRLSETHKIGAIARRMGIEPSLVSKYAKGGSKPRYDTAVRLARGLNVDIAWLLDDRRDWPPVWQNHEQRDGDEERAA